MPHLYVVFIYNQTNYFRKLPFFFNNSSSMTPNAQRQTNAAPCSALFLFFSLQKDNIDIRTSKNKLKCIT